MTPFRSEQFDNGLRVDFKDESNRYFGDYHRVCIDVTLVLDLTQATSSEEGADLFWQNARSVLGEQVALKKKLERMGVPSADVEQVRQQLADSFLEATASYLRAPGYLRSLTDAELKKRRPKRSYGY